MRRRPIIVEKGKQNKKNRWMIYSPDNHLVSKKSEIMESNSRLQIEKLEAKLKHYQKDNEELWDMNTKSEVLIKLHKMQKECKEQKISDQKNHIENLSSQIEKLKEESEFDQKQKIKI